MKINLEILDAATVFDPIKIEDLNEKKLVLSSLLRRRLTRNAKILIFLASKVGFKNERFVYGSSYGELKESISILKSIFENKTPSPTDFQNSVYNTPSAYLSIVSENTSETISVSNGDKTGENVIKTAAIKALDGDEIVLAVCESFNLDEVEKLNHCRAMCESGVIFRVKKTNEPSNISFDKLGYSNNFAPSISKLINLYRLFAKRTRLIIEIKC